MEVIGQNHILDYFKKVTNHNQLSHCYIIHGNKGTGKKTISRKIAQIIACSKNGCGHCRTCQNILGGSHPDVLMYRNDGKNVKLENISEFKNGGKFSPLEISKKILILEDTEMLTPQAANSILTMIEEPPEYLVIILLTNNLDKVLPTVKSRAVPFKIMPLKKSILEKYLCENKHLDKKEALSIANFSQGSLGQAIRLAETNFLSEREKVIELILKFKDNSISYADIESNVKDMDHHLILDLLTFWYRDVLYLQKGGDKTKIVNFEYYDILIEREWLDPFLAMKKIDEVRVNLDYKGNFILNLEVLFMRLQEV
ncbi:DNA polymerase III subunit [Proteinivorax hydrogeniformans]|uniref:DNA polymerase III subunit n=1 Tax=Proteinivorax hydrogeniformans TaxID=1826727 RepID=A0AAU8HTW4_9FIRM